MADNSFYTITQPLYATANEGSTTTAEQALALALDNANDLLSIDAQLASLALSLNARINSINDLYALVATLTNRVLAIELSGGGSSYQFRLDFNDGRNAILIPITTGL